MDHREVFDAQVGWYADYCDRHPDDGLPFTHWLELSRDGRALLAKIDLLDAPPPFDPPADRDMLAEQVAALASAVTLYAAHTENLIERVYALEGGDEGTVSHPEARFDDDPGWPHRPADATPTAKDT